MVGDKCFGMLKAVGEVFPKAKYQRCTVHFYRNMFSVTPCSKVKLVAKMLKAIHAQESKKAAREKAKAVVAQLREMKLKEATKKVEDGIEKTLTTVTSLVSTGCVSAPITSLSVSTGKSVPCWWGLFLMAIPDLILVCAWLHHVAGTQWGNKKCTNMKYLKAVFGGCLYCRPTSFAQSLQTFLRIILDSTKS